jgi:hypothetical protein
VLVLVALLLLPRKLVTPVALLSALSVDVMWPLCCPLFDWCRSTDGLAF